MMTKAAIGSFTALLLATGASIGFPAVADAVGLVVTPASVAANYSGTITLNITGLNTGETVVVEKLLDPDGDGILVGPGHDLMQRFTVTDGQLAFIGGVRNSNVPGDEDGAPDGQIRTVMSFKAQSEGNVAIVPFVYQVSTVGGSVLASAPFTVTQPSFSQGVVGQVFIHDGGGLPTAFVGLLIPSGSGVFESTFSDASGHFTLNSPPGTYQLFAVKQGFLFDFSTAPMANVSAGQFPPQTFSVTTATSPTISGQLTDAGSAADIAAVQILASTGKDNPGLATITHTNQSGNFSIPVSATATNWKLEFSNKDAALLGYVALRKVKVDTGAGDVNLPVQWTKATALIYGSLKDDSNHPLPGIEIDATDNTDQYQNFGLTDANGNYAVGVTGGNWNVGPSSDDPALAGYLVSGQNVNVSNDAAIQVNLVAQAACAHLRGHVLDGTTGVGNVSVMACPQNQGGQCPFATTGSDGSFDIAVPGGMWNLFLESNSAAQQGLIGSQISVTVTCPQDQVGLTLRVLHSTAQITGTVQDSHHNLITTLGVFAFATIDGTQYNTNGETDNNGHYSLPVTNGTWQVGLSCGQGNDSLGSRGLPCVDNKFVTISGHDAAVDFTVQDFSAHLQGRLVDLQDNGIGNVGVAACPQGPGGSSCNNVQTGADGSFTVGVFGGMWSLSFYGGDLAPRGLVGPVLNYTVTDGVDQTGITATVLPVTAHISGTVRDGSSHPVTNLNIFASATINGTQYNINYDAGGQTDQNGHYSFGVADGNWSVSLDCGGPNGLSSRGLPCVPNQSALVSGQDKTLDFCVGCGPPPPCVGDCSLHSQVTVDDILTMVDIALGNENVANCRAGDANHDDQITVDEILAAVNNALNTCPAT